MLFVFSIIATILLLIIIPLFITLKLMKRFIRRYDMDKYSFSLRISEISYAVRNVEFMSDETTLHGYVINEEGTRGLIIFCHGLFGGAEEYLSFALHFADKGFAVFMYDNTGCNRSGGKDIKGALQGLRDLSAAMEYIKSDKSLSCRKKVLVGHSWGGFTSAAYPYRNCGIEAAISLAGFDISIDAISDFICGKYGRFFRIALPYYALILYGMYGKTYKTSAVDSINRSGIPYLIIQGTNDKIINYKGSSIINKRNKITNPNAEFILYEDVRHNKHNTIFRDADATSYMTQQYRLMSLAKKTYSGVERDEKLADIYAQTDRFRINTLDARFIKDIDTFLDKIIDKIN